jgi:hypothetical protein
LDEPAHDIDGCIVAVEQGSRRDHPHPVFQFVASVLAFTHICPFLTGCFFLTVKLDPILCQIGRLENISRQKKPAHRRNIQNRPGLL